MEKTVINELVELVFFQLIAVGFTLGVFFMALFPIYKYAFIGNGAFSTAVAALVAAIAAAVFTVLSIPVRYLSAAAADTMVAAGIAAIGSAVISAVGDAVSASGGNYSFFITGFFAIAFAFVFTGCIVGDSKIPVKWLICSFLLETTVVFGTITVVTLNCI